MTGSFACVNERCRAWLDGHDSQGRYRDPGGVMADVAMADVAMATVCLYCGTVIVVGRDGAPRHPTDAERAVIEASEGYRAVRAVRGSLAAAVRRATAHLN